MSKLCFQFAVALCALSPVVLSQRNCYYPGGQLSVPDTACQPHAAHSMCCNPNDDCLSNGLCYVTAVNRLSRGSCTDSSWSPGSCTDICTGFDSLGHADAPDGWSNVLPCANTSLPQFFYCTGSNTAQCAGPKTFNIPRGFINDLRNETLSSNSSQSNSTTGCGSSDSPNSTNSSTSHNTCPSPASAEAAIGAGIGIPLALVLAATLVLFLRERRLRREEVKALIQQQYEMKPAPVRNNFGGELYEVDARTKPNVFEVPAHSR